MLWQKNRPIDKETSIFNYKGIFKKELSIFQAVALVVCGTVGAGVLGIPFAVSKVGLKMGIFYIIILGFLMMGLNLLLGYVAVKTKQEMQLVGLAKRYLGKKGEIFMTGIVYLMLFGTLLIYIIGAGDILSNLFGLNSFLWSLIFFIFASFFISKGLRDAKTIEFFVSLAIITIILLIAYFSLPHLNWENIKYSNWTDILLPYGIILFAFHGTSTVPEAHALLKNRDADFKKVIIYSGLIVMILYLLFTFVVIGVTGNNTTQIATIGLGSKVGESMYLFGNIFALLAMFSSFIMAGLALKDSLVWDYKLKEKRTNIIVLALPLLLFLLGFRDFTKAIDLVGGIFISLEMFMILFIYWRAANEKKEIVCKYNLHHTLFLIMALILMLLVGTVYSVLNIF
ncbi:MAG: aromatic amino acid transport family protein [Patescibacteria group bacterium]